MQLNSISESHLRREEEMFHQIFYLQDKLNQAPEAIPPPEFVESGPSEFTTIQGGQDTEVDEEEDE